MPPTASPRCSATGTTTLSGPDSCGNPCTQHHAWQPRRPCRRCRRCRRCHVLSLSAPARASRMQRCIRARPGAAVGHSPRHCVARAACTIDPYRRLTPLRGPRRRSRPACRPRRVPTESRDCRAADSVAAGARRASLHRRAASGGGGRASLVERVGLLCCGTHWVIDRNTKAHLSNL